MAESLRNGKRTAEGTEKETSTASFSKKTKTEFCFEELDLPSLNAELRGRPFLDMAPGKAAAPSTLSHSGAADFCSGDSRSSRCSSNEWSEFVQLETSRFPDLEAKSFEAESSTCIYNKYSREMTPSSVCGDTDTMNSPARASELKNCWRKSPEMPSQAEINEFLTVAEKNVRKRFEEKYNYDVVKDVPLEGRYQWVRLKP